jgi:hypothetical protein
MTNDHKELAAALAIAESFLDGQINGQQACRRMLRFRSCLEDLDADDALLGLRAVDSELDHVPIEEAEALWERRALAEAQAARDRYLVEVDASLREDFVKLVHRLKERLGRN